MTTYRRVGREAVQEHDGNPCSRVLAPQGPVRRAQLEVAHAPQATLHAVISDVTEATFERDVIERSKTVPVVVDFLGELVRGPCRQLRPRSRKP
jgi:putative thioredoxin